MVVVGLVEASNLDVENGDFGADSKVSDEDYDACDNDEGGKDGANEGEAPNERVGGAVVVEDLWFWHWIGGVRVA